MSKRIMVTLLFVLNGITLLGCESLNSTLVKNYIKKDVKSKSCDNNIGNNKKSHNKILKKKQDNIIKQEYSILGNVKDNIYSNEYFKFKINAFENFTFSNCQFVDKNNKSQQDNKSKVQFNNLQVIHLFSVFKNKNQANIKCYIEKLNPSSLINDSFTYLNTIKKSFIKSSIPFEIKKEIYKEKVNNYEFQVFEGILQNHNHMIIQKYYSIQIKEYVVNFILTYTNTKEEKELKDIMSTLESI